MTEKTIEQVQDDAERAFFQTIVDVLSGKASIVLEPLNLYGQGELSQGFRVRIEPKPKEPQV